MPRKRMIDPSFWKDPEIANLTDPERLLFIGMFSNADDEGRIIATPESLKADVFPYDHKKTASVVRKLRDSICEKLKNVCLYQNCYVDYIAFLRWSEYQKPKHPKPSKLPDPPRSPLLERGESLEKPMETSGETRQEKSLETEGRPSLGQSSQGKVSIGQVSTVQGDFKGLINTDINDLTDYLMKKMTKSISAGRAGLAGAGKGGVSPDEEANIKANWGVQPLKQLWRDVVGKDMSTGLFEGALRALKEHPLDIVAKSFVKAAKYKGGKHMSWKYIQTIIDEEIQKHGRSPPH